MRSTLIGLFKKWPEGEQLTLLRLFAFLIAGITILIAAQFIWIIKDSKEAAFKLARADALTNYEKDISYRKWATAHGGVYVLLDGKTVPNPYLDVPDRDIETIKGLRLTLVNPAWMTREVHEFSHNAKETSHTHITSLKVLNPVNEPDEWEKKALHAFKNGLKELVEVADFQGEPHLRLMRPLYTETGCLKCHAKQGYKKGDLRGGISVAIPFDAHLAVLKENFFINLLWHVFLWIVVVVLLFYVYICSKRLFGEKEAAEVRAIVSGEESLCRLQELQEENLKREQAETERERLHVRLVQAQKMEAIGTLAGGIAHDFNNILSAIFGFTELAQTTVESIVPGADVTQLTVRLREDLRQVMAAGNRARDLVRQILTFSRQKSIELVPIELVPCLKGVMNLVRSSIPTTIEIVQNITTERSVINADPTQIHQVVMNLCTNAWQAMEHTGGKLSVTLKRVVFGAEELRRRPEARAGEYMQLSICDTGIGIDPVVKERIFDPYFTTKKEGKGTGMGLAIVHGIISSYGGFITVYSELGKGTSFNLYIPAVSERVSVPEEVARPVLRGSETILLVDDEPSIISVCQQGLELLGYKVVSTESSLEALKIFTDSPGDFDLVITDHTMPEMTGVQLTQKISEIYPDVRVILCTGLSTEKMKVEIKAMKNIKEFVQKPITTSEMSRVIRRALDE